MLSKNQIPSSPNKQGDISLGIKQIRGGGRSCEAHSPSDSVEYHTHPARSISNAKPYHAHLDHLGGQNIAAGHLDPADCTLPPSLISPTSTKPCKKSCYQNHPQTASSPSQGPQPASEAGNLSESFLSLISHHTV